MSKKLAWNLHYRNMSVTGKIRNMSDFYLTCQFF